jgi:hypothetical protein
LAIRNKQAAEGQDGMIEKSFDLQFDVVLSEETEASIWIDELITGIAEYPGFVDLCS